VRVRTGRFALHPAGVVGIGLRLPSHHAPGRSSCHRPVVSAISATAPSPPQRHLRHSAISATAPSPPRRDLSPPPGLTSPSDVACPAYTHGGRRRPRRPPSLLCCPGPKWALLPVGLLPTPTAGGVSVGTPLSGASLRPSGRTPPGSRKNFQTGGPPPFSGSAQISERCGRQPPDQWRRAQARPIRYFRSRPCGRYLPRRPVGRP
jgi:hypothetical protein